MKELNTLSFDEKQDDVLQRLTRIHHLAMLINTRKTHIVFYEISGHVDLLKVSVRNTENYNSIIVDTDSYYRVEQDNDVYNENIVQKLEAIEQMLLRLIHNPEINSIGELITNQKEHELIECDIPF